MSRAAERTTEQSCVLVVDDQEANITLLERMLRGAGYENVRCTTDPRWVISNFVEIDPDLILLDLHMPGLDGFEALGALKRLISSDDYVPILVLTADANLEAKQRALSLGAKDFLTKPFDRMEVLFRIKNLLETRSLHLELRRHNSLLERRVRERTAEIEGSLDERRMLLSRLVTAQEEERGRIANDIHDDSIQVMIAARMHLQLLRRTLMEPEQLRALKSLDETVGESVDRLRKLLFQLRPPVLESEGLAAALRINLEEDRADGGPAYEIVDRLSEEPPAEIGIILYRIAQEVLVNVRKHAHATKVHLLLAGNGAGFQLTIRDDGVGFDQDAIAVPRPGHLGLTSVRERVQMAGGWCRIESAPGAGTTVGSFVPAVPSSSAGEEPDALPELSPKSPRVDAIRSGAPR
jgi:signal transduction histidine kinase